MGSNTLATELRRYFNFRNDIESISGFVQQKAKLKVEVFRQILMQFISNLKVTLLREEYMFVAVDGCEFRIFNNPNDSETYHEPSDKTSRGYNSLFAVALYDLLTNRYLDMGLWARLIMYNFSSAVTENVASSPLHRKYLYKINFSEATRICFDYLRKKVHDEFDIDFHISRHLEPVRQGRTFERNQRFKRPFTFLYRNA